MFVSVTVFGGKKKREGEGSLRRGRHGEGANASPNRTGIFNETSASQSRTMETSLKTLAHPGKESGRGKKTQRLINSNKSQKREGEEEESLVVKMLSVGRFGWSAG